MDRPCVRVPTDRGEATREQLVAAGVLDHEFDIVVDEGTLYLPVTDSADVPEEFDVVTHDVPSRTPQRTPEDILGYAPTYERLGDVVIVDEDDPDRAAEIAQAIVDSDIPVRSVINRASKIQGETRIREWDVLVHAPEPDDDRPPTETVHREYGHEFLVDVAEVYFSPRLATERHRVVSQVAPDEQVVDMFAGVGPYAIPMAAAGAEVVACDLNPAAIEYLEENARRNGVADRITTRVGDVRDVGEEFAGWADRLVMNLPHTANEFVETAVALASDDCIIHLYDIQHEDDPFGPGLAAVEAAAGDEYTVEVLEEQVVRSYAPHEYNVCLDVRLRRN